MAWVWTPEPTRPASSPNMALCMCDTHTCTHMNEKHWDVVEYLDTGQVSGGKNGSEEDSVRKGRLHLFSSIRDNTGTHGLSRGTEYLQWTLLGHKNCWGVIDSVTCILCLVTVVLSFTCSSCGCLIVGVTDSSLSSCGIATEHKFYLEEKVFSLLPLGTC